MGDLGFESWLATRFPYGLRQVISFVRRWGEGGGDTVFSFLIFKVKNLDQVIFFFFRRALPIPVAYDFKSPIYVAS